MKVLVVAGPVPASSIQKVNVGAGSDGMGKKCVFRSLLYKDLIQALKASGISRK